jgi:hypothetical protein
MQTDERAANGTEPAAIMDTVPCRLPPPTLADGLRSPERYGVDDHPGPSIRLWLEDVVADPAPWSIGRYAITARHPGAWYGVYRAGRRLPDVRRPRLSSAQERSGRRSAGQ